MAIRRPVPHVFTCLVALILATFPAVHSKASGPALKARGGAKTSINSAAAARPAAASVARPVARPGTTGSQRPAPVRPGGNVNINQDNDINVNIQGNHHGGSGYYPPSYDDHDHHHDHWDDWDDWDDHPFATAAAVTAGVAVTNAIIGSIVYSVPQECVPVAVNGITYQRCGNTWYQPQYAGTAIQYVVVVSPI